jgi:hypothetical protein
VVAFTESVDRSTGTESSNGSTGAESRQQLVGVVD